MPVLVGWLFRIGARLLSGWMVPVLVVLFGWLVEALTGVVSWGLVQIGQAVLVVAWDALDAITLPAPIDLRGFSGQAWDLLSVTGMLAAVATVTASGVARAMLRWIWK